MLMRLLKSIRDSIYALFRRVSRRSSTVQTMSHSAVALTEVKKLAVVSVTTSEPAAGQVLIKVELGTFSAFDNHQVQDNLFVQAYPQVLGIAGVGKIVKLGDGVEGLEIGDYVGVATFPPSERAIQEYVVADQYSIIKIPKGLAGEKVAPVIDNFVTAWWTICDSLKLALPSEFPASQKPDDDAANASILIWGGGTTSAQFVLQILKASGYKNIIATASSRSRQAALDLGASEVLDYNDPDVAKKIRAVAGGPVAYAIDTVSTTQSLREIGKVTETGSTLAFLLPVKVGEGSIRGSGHEYAFAVPEGLIKEGVNVAPTSTFNWQTNPDVKNNLLRKILPSMLENGLIKPPGTRVYDKGSLEERAKEAAEAVASGTIGGDKAVIKVSD
ncbi:hypothetical protein FRC03_009671 [Tulasnella sp. 419]|nr:hypothetical protein FRC02_009202 [Tulasnella sp. 418]KAG8957950.1 hypothetical protein FRC03_009671 [Tulasnella sp. 419]